MKKTTPAKITARTQQRRARVWARIIPASQIVQPYTGVIRHVGKAY